MQFLYLALALRLGDLRILRVKEGSERLKDRCPRPELPRRQITRVVADLDLFIGERRDQASGPIGVVAAPGLPAQPYGRHVSSEQRAGALAVVTQVPS